MTVSTAVNKTAPMVMGSLYDYTFSFRCLLADPTEEDAEKAIKVLVSNGTTDEELTYLTDYTVTLNSDGSGGTVTVNDCRTSDYYLIVYREYQATQGSDYENFNSFPADTLEENIDKLTMLIQQTEEVLSRVLKVKMSYLSGVNLEMPNPSPGKVLQWNSAGTGLENSAYNWAEMQEALDNLATAVASKQDVLTFDNTPTQNSSNPVTSDGIYQVVGDIADALDEINGEVA